MARFDDYHRTVVGYHGTGLTAALRIVNRVEGFRWSRRDFDWLGHGIYFWEYAPEQALNFAKIRQRQFKRKKRPTAEDTRRANGPLAVIACMIRLGFCFDLLEPKNVENLLEVFADYKENLGLAGMPLPKNDRKYRKLDCAVFEYAYRVIKESGQNASVDTARGVYVPTGGERRVWDGSWISRDTHIQLCVRNPANLLGVWLHYPTGLGVSDVCQTLQAGDAGIEREDQQSEEAAQGNAETEEN